ncbi:TetR/AcrR family transcriptional regulator [Streptomyces sp. TBY4]|uniref:TetR/AcrR family transcriptional regulator n=1 Tax=Streptomyces sp. TBY4 TaxID=2962030 RepID=UPI0020B6489D|nr:TetR/AcrR family transcriptional regulator [Streptomyces sp. TBY4]MCP3757217.1 TetR/AcrR family transcriptional regulator [Streptomyces sp. TBY4]
MQRQGNDLGGAAGPVAPRPLPRTEQGRRTRAAIIRAAGDLMYRQGVAGTGLDQVLEASGAGKSQLYHYFKNKQGLTEAVIDWHLEHTLALQPHLTALETWADFESWAEEFVALRLGPSGPHACPLGKLAGELDGDDALRGQLEAAYTTWESHLARGLTKLRQRGELHPEADPARLARAVMAAIQGGIMMARLHDDATPLRDAVAMAMRHLDACRVRRTADTERREDAAG